MANNATKKSDKVGEKKKQNHDSSIDRATEIVAVKENKAKTLPKYVVQDVTPKGTDIAEPSEAFYANLIGFMKSIKVDPD